jgi:hypothetical protein
MGRPLIALIWGVFRAAIIPDTDGRLLRTVTATLIAAAAAALFFVRVGPLLCPRCGRPFHMGPKYRFDFTRSCLHCGLRLDGANAAEEYRLADPMVPDYRNRRRARQ